MLRTHFSPHTLLLCLSLVATSGACSSSAASDAQPEDTGSAGRAENGGSSSSAGSSAGQAGHGSITGTGGTDSSTGSTTGETPDPGERGGSGAGGSGVAGAAAGGAGTAGSGMAGSAPDNSAAVARGKALATSNMCSTCHQDDYAGYAIYPNITPDLETGIGSWSDQEIIDAIRSERGRDNSTLCNLMVQFPFSDTQASDVVAFLRSLPAARHEVDEVCPGHVP